MWRQVQSRYVLELILCVLYLHSKYQRCLRIADFENRLDPDEAAHHELLHLDLHCLPSSF